jgi:hypothetical protein
MLTPTLKVRREKVQKELGAQIERAYTSGAIE